MKKEAKKLKTSRPASVDRQKLAAVLSEMPCDNIDDPRALAQNELFAEQANIELGGWKPTTVKPV